MSTIIPIVKNNFWLEKFSLYLLDKFCTVLCTVFKMDIFATWIQWVLVRTANWISVLGTWKFSFTYSVILSVAQLKIAELLSIQLQNCQRSKPLIPVFGILTGQRKWCNKFKLFSELSKILAKKSFHAGNMMQTSIFSYLSENGIVYSIIIHNFNKFFCIQLAIKRTNHQKAIICSKSFLSL